MRGRPRRRPYNFGVVFGGVRGHLSFLQIRRLARRISKDLVTVPFEVGLRGVRTPGLWAADGLTCETDQPIAGALGVSEVLGDQKPVIVIEADRTSVECLVVVGAQGEAVFLGVGAAVAVPVDVGRLDAEIGGTEQGIVAADRATVLVDAEDGVAEGRIARSSPGRPGRTAFPRRRGCRRGTMAPSDPRGAWLRFG